MIALQEVICGVTANLSVVGVSNPLNRREGGLNMRIPTIVPLTLCITAIIIFMLHVWLKD